MSVREDAQHAATEELLAAPLQAIFATNRSGRPPQLSPVWFIWEDGAMYVSTSAHSLKARSVLVDNHVSVCVDAGPGDYRYLAMSGEAEVLPHGSELQQEMRWRIIRKYYDTDEAALAYYEATADEESVLIVLRPNTTVYKDFNG